MSATLATVASGLLDAFAPLDRALRDPHAFRVLLRNLGWEKEFEDAMLAQPPLADVAAACAELISSGAAIADAIGDGSEDNDPLFEELIDVIGALHDLVAGLDGLDTADLPPALSDPDFWAELALDLPEYLIVRYLERYQPVLYGLLRLGGVIEDDEQALRPSDGREPYARRRIVWDHLVALIGGPAEHLQALYHWGDSRPFDHARLLDELASVAATAGVHFERLGLRQTLVDDFYGSQAPPADVREAALPILRGQVDGVYSEQGVLVAPVPRVSGSAVDGLFVTNLSWGRASTEAVTIAPGWTLAIAGSLDATGVAGVRVRPGVVELLAAPAEGSAELAVEGLPGDEPWRLLGAATGPRVELNGLRLALAFDADPDPDVTISARALPSADRGGIALTIDPTEGDGFLQRLMPASVQADASPDLRWSARDGFTLGGSASLDVVLPIEKSIGPVNIDSVHLALAGGDGSAEFLAAITGGVSLPPLDFVIVDVGFTLGFVPGAQDGLVDGLGITVGFKPPTGAGVSLELGDAAKGGGFIGHEPETGRYYGNLALEFGDYGLGAILVIDTRLPGDPDWALFASIYGTFPGLPLGFGFLLTGVGGIFALNRTMDVEALATGIKSGAADAIMFPDDPVGQGVQLVSQLDAWFPIADGSAVFGLDAQIAWGAKALITAEVGIVVSFPDLDIVLLGTITSVLPNEEDAQLELHMDTLGVIDLGAGTVWVTSALYDSSLLQTIHLSGSSAFYARFTDDPFFLLSVGGYHPSFQPPGGLPGAVLDLDRMRAEVAISDDVGFSLEAYFAVTSNSLQFGSEASLEMSSRFLGVTYAARGEISFDVLLVFSPFSFSVDFEASVTITAGSGDHELLAVSLGAHLEGPKPWYATGYARFKFLCVDVRFDIEVGGNAPAEAPPTQDVLELVREALTAPAAWRAVAPASSTVLAAAETAASEIEVWAGPDAELEAIQDVAPLNRELDHYGAYDIEGPSTLTIIGAGVEGASEALTWEEGIAYFAPAQYDELTRAEMLAAPSYEPMTAGVRFGIDGIALPAEDQVRVVAPRYERAVIDGEERLALEPESLVLPMDVATFAQLGGGARALAADAGPFAIEPVAWSTVDAVTGVITGSTGTYRSALGELGAAARGTQRIAPTHAARGTG